MPKHDKQKALTKTDTLDVSALLDKWKDELNSNPQFNQSELCSNTHTSDSSKHILTNILSLIEEGKAPDFSTDELKPIFDLWHSFLSTQKEKGVSAKETALLLFSLKSTLHTYLKDHAADPKLKTHPHLPKLRSIIDFLGLLSFEAYSAEKEDLITRQSQQIEYLETKIETQYGDIVGNSSAIRQIFTLIGMVLNNTVPILLEGESGTGKDLIANVIHKHSNRKHKPIVTLNCGAIPKDLVESELFGHEKGAFTGALEKRIGKFELASGGTLFLDEIGELSSELQIKLLRVLQNQEFERVGGSKKITTDARIIAATNKHLQTEVDAGRFRLDLYYRLNVFPIPVPPLRDRRDDIPALAAYFIKTYAPQFNSPVTAIDTDALTALQSHAWPGNIRELENTIQRAMIVCQSDTLSVNDLNLNGGTSTPVPGLPLPSSDIAPLDTVEKNAILHALDLKNGNMQATAKALGISRTTLYNKIEKYGLSAGKP